MRCLIIFMLVLVCGISTTTSQDHMDFWYATTHVDHRTSNLCRISISNDFEETCVNVPVFFEYAMSPNGSMIALRGQDGQIHLFNTTTQELISLELCQPTQEFLWDEYSYYSGALLWSPNTRYLAFTGVAELPCDILDQANIYIYDTLANDITNLTSDVPVSGGFITPSSWSPDSEWLILYGAWSQHDTNELDWQSVLISRQGIGFRAIASHYQTCRLIWSPDTTWLASNTGCFESSGTGSDLIFIPFDFDVLSNATETVNYIDEIVPPLHFGHRPTSGWTSRYTSPIWVNNQIAVAYRELAPISGGYLMNGEMESYSSKGIVAIDISTMTETMLADRSSADNTTQIGNWFISRQNEDFLFFNPLIDKEFILPATMMPCVVRDSIQISTQGNYIAIVHNCTFEGTHLFIYDTSQLDDPLFDRAFEMMQLTHLGFTS